MLTVEEISKPTCKHLVEQYHYSGKCPGIKYCFGLLDDGALVGCIVFSMPASYTLCNGVCGVEYRNFVIELSRLVIVSGQKNAASFLIGGALRKLPNHIVVSYADCNTHISHVGYVYQATNWIYTGQGSAEPIWLHPDGRVVSYTRRHVEDKAAKVGLVINDLIKKKQVGKYRYVFFTGSRTFKNNAKNALKYKTYPYPKGTTRRHDKVALVTIFNPG